jgi:N-acetylglucosaminyldiphosphoundecaprenol N-acetyl-beta-D-mannosaminyltransferase
MPIVWLSRLAGSPLKERVTGSDLFWELAAISDRTGLTLFYLGGRPGMAARAAEVVRERYPNVRIGGVYCPPFETMGSAEEDARIAERIEAARPDVLLVALGSPKQEKWIAAHRGSLCVPVSIGVGGSFEMAAGAVKRAPRILQRIGCEWLFRLMQEPRRLGRRYLGNDLPHLCRLIVRTLRERGQVHRDRDPESPTAPIPSPKA